MQAGERAVCRIIRAAAADQLIFAVQLQRHVAGAGDVHGVFLRGARIHLQVPQDDVQRILIIVDDLDHVLHHRADDRRVLLGRGFVGDGLVFGVGGFFGRCGGFRRGFGLRHLHIGVHGVIAVFDHGAVLGLGDGALRLGGGVLSFVAGIHGRGRQLQRCGLSGRILCVGIVRCGIFGALCVSGFGRFSFVSRGCIFFGRGFLVLGLRRCGFGGVVLGGRCLGVVAGDDDIIRAVAVVLHLLAAHLDGLAAVCIHSDVHTALADITDVGRRDGGGCRRQRHAQSQRCGGRSFECFSQPHKKKPPVCSMSGCSCILAEWTKNGGTS